MTGLRPHPGVIVLGAVLLALGVLSVVAIAGSTSQPTAAERAHQLASTLHCPVCADLSAADSPAPLARQMRQRIRQQLAAGATAEEIQEQFTDAYGPSVLMTPPDRGWGRAAKLAPWLVLGLASTAGALVIRRGLQPATVAEDR